jgi:LPXTG-motif cell wall-anchored protein
VNSDAVKTDAHGNTSDLVFRNNVKFNGNDTVYNNVFYLKPGEKATFNGILEDQDYFVQEIGISNDYYDEIYVNDVKIDGVTAQQQGGVYASSVATPRNRAQVTFSNHCDPRNTNELRITKRLSQGSIADGDTFEFRVMLENADGELAAYYQGKYYIMDDNGDYYRYENNELVNNGQTKYELKAGNYGTIAGIPADFTVVIEDLVAGTDYYVDEIRVHEADADADVLIGNSSWTLESTELVVDEANGIGYDAPEITNAQIYDYATSGNKTGDALGRIAWNKDAQVVFTNKLNALDLKLKKVDDQNKALNGAKFNLTRKKGTAWEAYLSDITPSGENAEVDIRSLRSGLYRLEETVTPEGYNILENKFVYFKVYSDNGTYKASLTNEAGEPATYELAGVSENNGVIMLNVKNMPGSELPQTGGTGTTAIYAAGVGLVCIAALGLVSKKLRNDL